MIKRFLIGFTVLISVFLFTNKASALNVNYNGVNYTDEWVYNKALELGYNLQEYEYITINYYLTGSYYFDVFAWNGSIPNITSTSYNQNKSAKMTADTNEWVHFEYYMNSGTTYNYSGTGSINNIVLTYVNTSTLPRGTVSGFNDLVYNGTTYTFDEFDWSFLAPKDPIIDETSKTITIPVNYFFQDGEWQNYYLYFAAPTINNMNYSLKFEYLSKDTNLPELPIELIIHDKIDDVHQHLANISNSKYTSGNGFGGGFSVNAGNFGGGGGGGRLDDDTDTNSCMATTPFTYSGSFSNERIYGLAALSLNSCYDLTGKTPDDFNTEAIKITYSARIVDLNTEGELGSDEIGDMLEDIRNEHQLEQDSISFEIFAPVIKLITDKLPIINQFNQILNQFNYNETFDTPPRFVVDIPYFNLKNVEVFNFQFFNDYRDYVLSLQCIVLAIFTGVKCYRIVSGYFGGGENE